MVHVGKYVSPWIFMIYVHISGFVLYILILILHWQPWEPTTFIFRGYSPYIGGVKPSFSRVLGSKGNLNLALDIDELIHSSLDESAGFRLSFTVGIPWWRTAGRHGRCRSDWTMSEKLRVKTVFCFCDSLTKIKRSFGVYIVFRWCDFACQTFTPMWKQRMTGRSSGWWYLIQVVESKLHRVDQSIAAWSWTNYLDCGISRRLTWG